MFKHKKTFLVAYFLFSVLAVVNGQLLDSLSLANAKLYKTLEDALLYPDSVYKLKLRKQKLTEFPMEVFEFKNLQQLEISKNKIVEIPKEIEILTYLQDLNLSQNRIEKLPGEIGALKNLKYLNLNRNDLVALPVQIGKLEKLEVLDLWSNNLVEFPEELSKLSNLKIIDLRVIEINDDKQKEIAALLPNARIYFSNSCNCGM